MAVSEKKGPRKVLYLLRHAKSDWSDAALNDHDRPLNGRGERAAHRMGLFFRDQKILPQLILCSTARRTVETLDRIVPFVKSAIVRYEEGLYLASWQQLLERVRWIEDGYGSAMLIGHNPGTEQLATILSRRPKTAAEAQLKNEMSVKFPTGALATLIFEAGHWKEVSEATAQLAGFIRPRDLDDVVDD